MTDSKNGNILIDFNMDNLLVTNITQLAIYLIVFLKYTCDLHLLLVVANTQKRAIKYTFVILLILTENRALKSYFDYL